ncbi:MAG TPA: fumarylacetoacetate hydrolase family protein, partial [Stellaceae bacterium]|nr:fumarylacetoacetate hydrolase family protein [Stellaceae bacterium]
MKILSFEKNGAATVGAQVAEGVVDLTACLRTTHPNIATAHSVLQIIQSGLDIDRFGEESITELRNTQRLARFVVEKPKFLPPVTNPPKILALALNFQEHIDETNLKFYEEPIVFTKYPSNMIGHEGEIELPPFPQKVDEEHELGLIVSKDCRHIRPSQAPDYVFGWTICNDVSARNRQRERGQMGQPYAYAKNLATFAPIGPWIVTKKELPDPRNLKMDVRINGKVT